MIIRILAINSYKSDFHGFYHHPPFLNLIVEVLHYLEHITLNLWPGSSYFKFFMAIINLLISPSQC